jgi:Glycosyltransferase family 87
VIFARAARVVAYLLAPLLFAGMLALNATHGPTYVMGDFRAFYCAGKTIAQGANPYLNEPLHSCEATAGPPEEPAFLKPVALPAPLPPYALLLFVPFALLPFPVAAVCWGALLVASMALAVALLRRVTGVSSVVLNLALAPIAATVTFYVGQPVPLVFAALAGAALFVRRERWAAAAACATFASIEPHVALAALAGMLVAFPRVRVPVLACGAVLGAASVAGVGLATAVAYVREVVPAHALANVYEWQFSLTSVLTSLGVAAPAAIRAGELMFAAMTVLGVLVALRLRKATGDAAVMVIVPPAFALFGGVHVHFQQLAVAFPAVLYAYARYPRVRALAASGLAFAMIPWNVMGASVLAGVSPLAAGTFGALTLGRRAGLAFAVAAAAIGVSLLLLATFGFGPTEAHFVARAYPPNALAELSWGDFSRVALARPSVMMQWLRIPTMAGLACGLLAIAWAAFGDAVRMSSFLPRRGATPNAAVPAP